MKHRETHSPIEKASHGESAPREVMANAPTDESRSRMRKSHSRMRSRLSLDNLEIRSCYWKSTSESILANRYGTRRNRNGLVVGGATTYKWGMTVSESKSTPTASNHRTGSAGRKHLGAHLPAENSSWRRVNKKTRRCAYPDK
jgi:hypothetical protein